tara:strand:- start:2448 stop:3338 length:891 start_codon:yes stop_codon:yes gene_type:complete
MAESLMGSDSILARVTFITIVIIVFFILLRIGVLILSLINEPDKNPVIMNGMQSGESPKKFNVNPNKSDSTPIFRSDNEKSGLEFTWSVWINVEEKAAAPTDRVYHVFNKGEITQHDNTSSNYFDINGPGVYLKSTTNPTTSTAGTTNQLDLHVLMDVHDRRSKDNSDLQMDITSLSLNKWINIIIRGKHDTIDLFIGGILVKRQKFSEVLKQNYGHVYVGQELKNSKDFGVYGFPGRISGLTYFDHAIGTTKMLEIQKMGPNLTYLGKEDYEYTLNNFFSNVWYSGQLLPEQKET